MCRSSGAARFGAETREYGTNLYTERLRRFQHILKRGKLIAAMVEDCIEHDADPFFMAALDKCFQRLFVPKVRVDFKIISGVVFMVRRRAENRRQVKAGDAKVSQVIEMVDNSLQIPPKKLVGVGSSLPHGRAPSGLMAGLPLANRSGKI